MKIMKIIPASMIGLMITSLVCPVSAQKSETAAETMNVFEARGKKQTAQDFKPAADKIETSFGTLEFEGGAFPTLGSQTEGVKKNKDGSYDIYFAPKPPEGQKGNWLQTIPGKSWWLALRMYGPEEAWIKQTWRPGEIELVE